MVYNEKVLKRVAITAMCLATLAFGEFAAAYFILGKAFAIAEAHHPDVHWLLFACKVSTFLICPGLCILIVGISLTILRYLKTNRDQIKAQEQSTTKEGAKHKPFVS